MVTQENVRIGFGLGALMTALLIIWVYYIDRRGRKNKKKR